MDVVALAHIGPGLIVASPLIYAGVTKLLEPSRFVSAMPRYFLPVFITRDRRAARAVGLFELGVAASTLVVAAATTAALLALTYLVLTIAVARAWGRGSRGDCGCFGSAGGEIGIAAVVRNAMLSAGCTALALARAAGFAGNYDTASAGAALALVVLVAGAIDVLLQFGGQPA